MKKLEERVKNYWTNRVKDFADIRINELKDQISDRWVKKIEEYIPKNNSLDILDIGTGVGYFAILLENQGHILTGIDLTPAMIEKANTLARERNSKNTYLVMDAQQLFFDDNSFDVIVTRNLTWTLPDVELAYKEWYRVLRKEGMLLNFDACYGKNIKNERKNKDIPLKNCVYGDVGITPELEKENADITNAMMINKQNRPEWDIDILKKCGFKKCGREPYVGKEILKEMDKKYAPMFLVWAQK